MSTTLCLVRHARAAGHTPESDLMPEGLEQLARLGRLLAGEGFRPLLAFSSPYERARRTAEVLLWHVGSPLKPNPVHALTPEGDTGDALREILAYAPGGGRILVVSHLPLVAHFAFELTGQELEFLPATLVEIELARNGRTGTLVRRIGPESLPSS